MKVTINDKKNHKNEDVQEWGTGEDGTAGRRRERTTYPICSVSCSNLDWIGNDLLKTWPALNIGGLTFYCGPNQTEGLILKAHIFVGLHQDSTYIYYNKMTNHYNPQHKI